MSQGSLSPQSRYLGQKKCSAAHGQTHKHTDTKVNTEDTLSVFQDFYPQPIIKDPPNKQNSKFQMNLRRGENWLSEEKKKLTKKVLSLWRNDDITTKNMLLC